MGREESEQCVEDHVPCKPALDAGGWIAGPILGGGYAAFTGADSGVNYPPCSAQRPFGAFRFDTALYRNRPTRVARSLRKGLSASIKRIRTGFARTSRSRRSDRTSVSGEQVQTGLHESKEKAHDFSRRMNLIFSWWILPDVESVSRSRTFSRETESRVRICTRLAVGGVDEARYPGRGPYWHGPEHRSLSDADRTDL